MSILFRGMSSKKGKSGESAVKKSLIIQLSAAVKDLQIDQADEYLLDSKSNDSANVLCTILEAIFLHGLKDSFLRRVTIAVRSDFDEKPEPNFWAPLLFVSHRNVIDQISKLNLVTTDIGRSRAWIRLALNDSLMSRYLESIRKEGQRPLSQYYRQGALLRDTEMLDVAQKLIEGLEAVPLSLPLNSSLLDSWTQQPLLLSGLWTPPLRATALQQSVATGVEVGEVLDREDRESLSDAKSIMSLSSFPGTGIEQMMSLNEEDSLRIILGTPVYETPIAARERAEQSLKGVERREEEGSLELPPKEEENIHAVSVQGHIQMQDNTSTDIGHEESQEDSGKGNSLSARFGWSSSFEGKDGDSGAKEEREEKTAVEIPPPRQGGRKLESFHSLLESYRGAACTSHALPLVLDDLLRQFEAPAQSPPMDLDTRKQMDLAYPHDLGFEVIDNLPAILKDPEYAFFLQEMTKLPLERGLDVQKYKCLGCGEPIGLNFLPAKVCGLSGRYFCKDCTSQPGEEWVVPSRILHNWDFRRVAVSLQAAKFLEDIQHHPLFDVKIVNPRIYLAVQEMKLLQRLRTELNLLRAYLFTCCRDVIAEFREKVWPREYLYEHVHLYSLADLLEVPTGLLAQHLKRVINFARGHVLSCRLCSQKGFFCEVCYKDRNNQKIIYPFDTTTTYRCPGCSAVFHAVCLDSTKPCPKCVRFRRRDNVSNLDEIGAF